MISDSFRKKFDAWLDRALAKPVPAHVVAFNFNLSEPWSVELIGADRYSEEDADWACPPEAFRPKGKKLRLPESECGSDWQSVLEAAKSLVVSFLDRGSSGSERLRQAQGVTVGFVDGDLHKVWPR